VLIENKECLSKELESLIGKLERICIVIPGAGQFLKLLRSALYRLKHGIAYLNHIYILDLKL